VTSNPGTTQPVATIATATMSQVTRRDFIVQESGGVRGRPVCLMQAPYIKETSVLRFWVPRGVARAGAAINFTSADERSFDEILDAVADEAWRRERL
jgi:hypothetical protein